MRTRRKLLWLGVLTAMIGVLLVATTSSAVGQASDCEPGGILELDVREGLDAFVFSNPDDADCAEVFETYDSTNQARLIETLTMGEAGNLVDWTAFGPRQGQLPYVGLKEGQFGVRAKGEGAGEPTSQVNDAGGTVAATDVEPFGDGQALRLVIEGKLASYAELSFKFKFGARVLVEALDANGDPALWNANVPGVEGATAGYPIYAIEFCDPTTDCGPDSGSDLQTVAIGFSGSGGEALFSGLQISIVGAADGGTDDGAVGLVDAPDFETYFEIAPFDGVLACGGVGVLTDDTEFEGEAAAATFLRIETSDEDISDGCDEPPKPYVLALNEGSIPVDFAPSLIPAAYRFDINIVDDFANGIDDNDLEYDPDGDGSLSRRVVPVCEIRDKVPGDSNAFDEFGLVTAAGAPGFPTLVGLPVDDTACVVAYDHVRTRGYNHWAGYLEDDPHFF